MYKPYTATLKNWNLEMYIKINGHYKKKPIFPVEESYNNISSVVKIKIKTKLNLKCGLKGKILRSREIHNGAQMSMVMKRPTV